AALAPLQGDSLLDCSRISYHKALKRGSLKSPFSDYSEQGGFGVLVANILFAPVTPPPRFPARPAPALLVKAYALSFLQKRSVSNPPICWLNVASLY
ncbi:MAG TPA: hypothetical protein DEQ14_00175, partial [Treponema sp.]|nr:hypothetical protein [Treponema sp.]